MSKTTGTIQNTKNTKQKSISKKRNTQPGRQSPLRECEYIEYEIDILDECDLEIYRIITSYTSSQQKGTSTVKTDEWDDLEEDFKLIRKSTRTLFDSF